MHGEGRVVDTVLLVVGRAEPGGELAAEGRVARIERYGRSGAGHRSCRPEIACLIDGEMEYPVVGGRDRRLEVAAWHEVDKRVGCILGMLRGRLCPVPVCGRGRRGEAKHAARREDEDGKRQDLAYSPPLSIPEPPGTRPGGSIPFLCRRFRSSSLS